MVKIFEVIGIFIMIKGLFYLLGKEVFVGVDLKLYILIEGDMEVVVSFVFMELIRLLREGMIVVVDVDSRVLVSGRYIVI